MQQLAGRRTLALVAALALGLAGSALAQDTTETGAARFDTTEAGAGAIDTGGVDTTAASDTVRPNDTTSTDTTASDTSDTSGVQNPPGYRGMERDTTIFPSKGEQEQTPEQAEGQATGRYEDTADADQNPPGYRGMETPVGDSGAEHDSSTHHPDEGVGDTTAQTPDSTQ